MFFLGFISGKRIQFPGKWAKTSKNPGSLTSTQVKDERIGAVARFLSWSGSLGLGQGARPMAPGSGPRAMEGGAILPPLPLVPPRT